MSRGFQFVTGEMFAVTALSGSFRNCLKPPQNAGAEGNYRLPISDSLMHIK